nr:MAG TPA: hypothetical protein [Caudoviricetes sp.]
MSSVFGLVFFAFVVCIMPQKHIYSKSIRGHICTKHEGGRSLII